MTTLTQAQRMSAYRQKMRDSGFRQITAWVLDTRKKEIQEQLKQECEAIRNHQTEKEDLAFCHALFEENVPDDWIGQ